ncbi:hypothetical protein SFC76_03160 [Sphingomonas sp. CD22]|uniref:hypothetical protein n=1 Tax=Sphingomonas sp. CD22 TaxID=3100214 RepID=UPI002ADF3095|nr:hypothetical protein [Sphingomonas sp. CD22]MEA1083248.1 hypothetical protein [Sphingomonas sp. CD22]
MHTIGPDDVYAAPDFDTAAEWADRNNRLAEQYTVEAGRQNDPLWPFVRSVVAVWPWSAEAHARELPGSVSACSPPATPPPTPADELIALADRVKALKSSDSSVDVLVEIALFTASPKAVSVRANAAGTKVIYTDADGNETTHWPWDWTHQQLGKSNRRAHTAAALRARAVDMMERRP